MKLTLEGNSLYLDAKRVGAIDFTVSIAERDQICELFESADDKRIRDLKMVIADMRSTFDSVTGKIEEVVQKLREAVQE